MLKNCWALKHKILEIYLNVWAFYKKGFDKLLRLFPLYCYKFRNQFCVYWFYDCNSNTNFCIARKLNYFLWATSWPNKSFSTFILLSVLTVQLKSMWFKHVRVGKHLGVSRLAGKKSKSKKSTAVNNHMLFSDHIYTLMTVKCWQLVTQISMLRSKKVFWCHVMNPS